MTEALAHYSLQKLLLGILDVVAVNRLGLLQSNLGMRGGQRYCLFQNSG